MGYVWTGEQGDRKRIPIHVDLCVSPVFETEELADEWVKDNWLTVAPDTCCRVTFWRGHVYGLPERNGREVVA